MKKKIVIPFGLAACGLAWAAKDPVIMTVNGVDVPKSEFEYLYNKNSKQQIEPQSLEDYVETFKVYKLKVADARAHGLDTAASYVKETMQYRDELAAPYLNDSTYILSFVDETMARMDEEVEASHIMIGKTRRHADNVKAKALADSLRKVIADGDATFDDIAVRFSQDRSAKTNRGHLGYIAAGKFPYPFETAVYTLAEGELSDVIDSGVGYHILLGGKHRPARGQVKVEHILKMVPKNATAEQKAEVRRQIDSIYNIVKDDPRQFEKLAAQLSDDKNSGRQGGLLPWFGSGEMVAAFDSVAFAAAPGDITAPFESQFGWHIIKKLDSRKSMPAEQVKAEVLRKMQSPQDARHRMVRRHHNELMARKHDTDLNSANLAAMREALANGLDSVYISRFSTAPDGDMAIAAIDGKPLPASELIAMMAPAKGADADAARDIFDLSWERLANRKLLDAEEEALAAVNDDYRNLLNEYCEGTLLFNISNQMAWEKASRDKEGLEKYFASHRDEYKWDAPRVKGYLVQTVGDSVTALVKERLNTLGGDTIGVTIRREFPGKAQAERVLVAKGANPQVDALFFATGTARPTGSFTDIFLYEPRLIEVPEEVSDVKGQVISDYQNVLMDEWVARLKDTYPVTVNEKELKKIKRN